MRKLFAVSLSFLLFSNVLFATDYGDVTGWRATLEDGDTISLSSTGQIGDMNGGTVNSMINSTNLYRMHDGTVESMDDSAKVHTMHKGTIEEMKGSSNVGSMNNGTIESMEGSAFVSTMAGGTVVLMDGNSKINYMTPATINPIVVEKMQGNSSIGTAQGANAVIKEMTDNASINWIDNSNGNTITIEKMSGSSKVNGMGANTAVNIMEGNASIAQMHSGTVGSMGDSATVGILNNGTIGTISGYNTGITTMNNGTVTSVSSGGYIATMRGGTLTTLEGTGAVYNAGVNAVIGTAKDSSVISSLDGKLTNLTGNATVGNLGATGKITNIYGNGEITNMNAGAVDNMYGNSSIGKMTDGTVTEMYDTSHINTMNGGTVATATGTSYITAMNGGKIESMEGSSKVTTMTAGRIDNMSDNAYLDLGKGGTIGIVTDNAQIRRLETGVVVTELSGSAKVSALSASTITDVKDNAVVGSIGSSGKVGTLSGNGDVQHIYGGTIDTMNGGKVGNLDQWGYITTINSGTIYGNVAQSANSSQLNVTQDGSLILDDGGLNKTFDRGLTTGSGADITVKSYNFGTNAAINLGADSVLNIGMVDLQTVNFLGKGTLNIKDYSLNVPHGSASIQNFNAADQVVFNIDVEFEQNNAANDELTIVSNTGTHTDHLVNIVDVPSAVGSARDKINIIEDQSGDLSFSLVNGSQLTIGARNYLLESEALGSGNQWFLGLSSILSDAANIIGSLPTANLMSVLSMQDALHRRMGDIRNYSPMGLWTRVYTNQVKFEDLAKTEVSNYGFEVGFDKQVAEFDKSKFSLGIGAGVSMSDIKIRSRHSKDGGGDTTMPYGGLYATWAWEDGFYLDAAARYAFADTEGYYYDNMNQKEKFDLTSNIGTISLEAGKQYYVSPRIVLEPRAKLDYVFMQGDSFTDNPGFKAQYDDTQSILGTLGLLARYDIGRFSPYAKTSFIYEFDGRTDIVYDDVSYHSDVRGWRAEGALGFDWGVSACVDLFAEAGYLGGANSYQNINGSIGMRYNFGACKKAVPVAAVVVSPEPSEEPLPAKKPVVTPIIIADIQGDKIATTYYAFDKYNLTPAARATLDKAAVEIKADETKSVVIVGHTDSTGTELYNQGLSERRARSAYNYLIDSGIAKSRVSMTGKGELEPIATNATKEGRAQNRRVEIYVF